MSSTTYTHAENASFLAELAGTLSRIGSPQRHIDHAKALAAKEAAEAEYVAYVNAKCEAAFRNPGRLYTEAEMDEDIKSWFRPK